MKSRLFLAFAALFLLTQCNSTKVAGVAPGTKIDKLYIVKNDKLHMSGMQPEVVKQVRELGINPELVDAPPAGNVHYMTYTANWSWDMAMYLRYFKAELFQGPQRTGVVEYKTSGFDMNKFGNTDAKIRPLLRELLTGVKTPAPKREAAPSLR